MPGYDRTGPMGSGPMTGGGFGRCNGGRRFGTGERGRGGGAGAGFCRGRGFRRRTEGWGTGGFDESRSSRPEPLQAYARDLEEELSLVRRRMSALAEENNREDQ